MSPIGTGWPNSWQTVVDHILGVAPGDQGSNACFVVEPDGLAGTLSAAGAGLMSVVMTNWISSSVRTRSRASGGAPAIAAVSWPAGDVVIQPLATQ